MKTAEEIYNELIGKGLVVFPDTKAAIKAAMKAYASQAIDKCAEEAETHDVRYPNNSFVTKEVDRDSILKVKSELK